MCLRWNKKKKLTARMHGVEGFRLFYIYLKYTGFHFVFPLFSKTRKQI